MAIISQLKSSQNNLRDCLNVQGKAHKKYITFSVPTEKELENDKTVTYKKGLLIA